VSHDRQIELLLRLAGQDPDVLAVILFGSRARADARPSSDTDVCLVLTPAPRDRLALGRKRLLYAGRVDLDVQVLQQLPLYVRPRVFREGRVLFVRDEDALYDVAFRTVRAFEAFKSVYRTYLAEVARAGS